MTISTIFNTNNVAPKLDAVRSYTGLILKHGRRNSLPEYFRNFCNFFTTLTLKIVAKLTLVHPVDVTES